MTAENNNNNAVALGNIPRDETMDFVALADNYAKSMIINVSAIWSLITIGAAMLHYFTGNIGNPLLYWQVYVLYLVPVMLIFILAPIIARCKGYAIREKDIHFKKGVVFHKTVSLPYNRIQHVEVESSPLERVYGLTTLKFFTAGGGSADMKIPALTNEASTKLRAYIIKKAGAKDAKGDHNG